MVSNHAVTTDFAKCVKYVLEIPKIQRNTVCTSIVNQSKFSVFAPGGQAKKQI
jgi:hypothetical protein